MAAMNAAAEVDLLERVVRALAGVDNAVLGDALLLNRLDADGRRCLERGLSELEDAGQEGEARAVVAALSGDRAEIPVYGEARRVALPEVVLAAGGGLVVGTPEGDRLVLLAEERWFVPEVEPRRPRGFRIAEDLAERAAFLEEEPLVPSRIAVYGLAALLAALMALLGFRLARR